MWKCLLILFALPVTAQVSRDALMELLDQGQDQKAVARVESQCIGFRVNPSDLKRLKQHGSVLMAVINCIQDKAGIQHESFMRAHAEHAPPEETRSTPQPVQPVTRSEPKPPTAKPTERKPVTRPTPPPAGRGPRNFSAVSEALRAFVSGQTLSDAAARNESIINAKIRLADALLHGPPLALEPPAIEGYQTPEWFGPVYENAVKARQTRMPVVTLQAAGNVMFRGVDGRDGAQVYVGLYMVDRHRVDKEPYLATDHIIYSHEQFPATYNRETNKLEFKKIKTRQVDVRLGRIFKKMDPLTLLPGNWVMEVIAYDGRDRLQARHKVDFTVEAGGQYTMKLSLKNDRNGPVLVKDLTRK